MRSTIRTVLLGVLCSSAVAALAQVGTAESDASERLTVEAVQHQIGIAAPLIGRDAQSAHALLQAVLDEPAFAELTAEEQGQALTFAASAAFLAYDEDLARELAIRATQTAPLNGTAWRMRTVTALETSSWADAAMSMTAMVRTAPSQLAHLTDAIASTLFNAARAADSGLFEELFDLLDAADVLPCSSDGAASSHCADMATLWLERNEEERAWTAAARVTVPYVIVAMRADRRFDGMVTAHPEHFDVDRAIERDLTRTRADFDRDPRNEVALLSYSSALLTADRPAEVVKLVSSRVRQLNQPPWLYDSRARAFQALGQHRQALADRKRARRLASARSGGVSFDINLANYLIERNEPDEALAVLPEPRLASGYGRMLIANVRFEAAAQLNDTAGMDGALAYLRENSDVSPAVFQSALLIAGKIDEAEQYFLSRLEDPMLRADALLSAQRFVRSGSMEVRGESDWNEFISRPKIQRAIENVGRIETYAMPAKRSR